jgi:hypothetical protein
MGLEFESELDALVTWMRKRGVCECTAGGYSVKLAIMIEPAVLAEAEKEEAERQAKLSPEEREHERRQAVLRDMGIRGTAPPRRRRTGDEQ